MKLTDGYLGNDDPFEGDRTLWLRSLPAGARVTKAAVTLTPVAPTGGTLFEEIITFTDSQGDLGATKAKGTGFVEVDFHARRTLAAVAGSNIAAVAGTPGANLQVDMGGVYVEINERGTIKAPGDNLFSLPADGKLPGLTVSKFKLTRATGTLDVTKITVRSVPTNVSVRLGQMPPFWTRLGELATAETSPDFATILNAFLAGAQPQNGFYAVPFVVHADTIARLDVALAIDFTVEQPVLPPYLPEVTLPYSFSTLPGADEALTTVTLPRGAIPVAGQSGAQVRGEFQPTRVAAGPVGEEPETIPVVVSPECSLAQPLRSDAEIAVTGIDLPLANTQPGLAGMNVAIQADADGKPFGEVLASAEVRVEKPLPGQSAWGSATLPAPFRVLPGERCWLVLQSRIGQAYWSATPGPAGEPALQCSRDGGLSWRGATAPGAPGPLAALFRLRHTPDRFSVPVQLQIGKGPAAVRRRLDEFAPLGRVEFQFDFAEKLAEHLSKPELASPCGAGELLVNGSFDQPPHDDATRRLFGFDAGSGTELPGVVNLSRGVDLSVERFITLSVDNGPPRRINCAGANPVRTTLGEVIAAINRVMGPGVAFEILSDTCSPFPTGRLGLQRPAEASTISLQPWRQAGVPQGWQRPAEAGGQIWRARLPTAHPPGSDTLQPERVVAILGATEAEPAILAQRVPVAGGCAYVLRFLFCNLHAAQLLQTSPAAMLALLPPVLNIPGLAAPSWEIHWLDAAGQLISRESEEFDGRGQFAIVESWLLQGEARLVAPSGAIQAEVRFLQPPPGFFFLDEVSFVPARETLANGGLRLWQVGSLGIPVSPLGWTLVSGWIDRDLTGVRLRGDGPEDAVLSQTTAVVAGERYELQVCARPLPPPAGDPETQPVQQRARLELRWLDDGSPGAPVILPLDGPDFATRAWAGAAPAGANLAEVRLIQPRGRGNLLVESVSIVRADLVSVPLILLAEAPGELTVSGLRVAYDLPQPPVSPAAAGVAPGIPPVVAGSLRSPLADRPIDIVAGVGDRFSGILGRLPTPIATIAGLAALDPEVEVAGIPRERRLELKTKAEMIMALVIEAAPFATLADESLETLLTLSPAELARRAGRPTPAQAERLQRDLRALRLLLKNEAFRSLGLSDLMPGGA